MKLTLDQALEQNRKFDANGKTVPKSIQRLVDADAKAVEDEGDLHSEIIAYCRERGWAYAHNRMDRKSTAGNGVADFIIFADRGRVHAIECKSRSGKRTVDQIGFAMQLNRFGHLCHLVKSMAEFREIIKPTAALTLSTAQ